MGIPVLDGLDLVLARLDLALARLDPADCPSLSLCVMVAPLTWSQDLSAANRHFGILFYHKCMIFFNEMKCHRMISFMDFMLWLTCLV